MKPSRLALLLSVFWFTLGIAGPAHAAGTSAEQFALMGGVFLVLGGTFVFAPQIVNAINGFMAAVLRRPRKAPKAPKGQAQEPHAQPGPVVHVLDVQEPAHQAPQTHLDHTLHEPQQSAWAPEEHHPAEHGHGGGVVSRLQEEINLSWSNPRDGE